MYKLISTNKNYNLLKFSVQSHKKNRVDTLEKNSIISNVKIYDSWEKYFIFLYNYHLIFLTLKKALHFLKKKYSLPLIPLSLYKAFPTNYNQNNLSNNIFLNNLWNLNFNLSKNFYKKYFYKSAAVIMELPNRISVKFYSKSLFKNFKFKNKIVWRNISRKKWKKKRAFEKNHKSKLNNLYISKKLILSPKLHKIYLYRYNLPLQKYFISITPHFYRYPNHLWNLMKWKRTDPSLIKRFPFYKKFKESYAHNFKYYDLKILLKENSTFIPKKLKYKKVRNPLIPNKKLILYKPITFRKKKRRWFEKVLKNKKHFNSKTNKMYSLCRNSFKYNPNFKFKFLKKKNESPKFFFSKTKNISLMNYNYYLKFDKRCSSFLINRNFHNLKKFKHNAKFKLKNFLNFTFNKTSSNNLTLFNSNFKYKNQLYILLNKVNEDVIYTSKPNFINNNNSCVLKQFVTKNLYRKVLVYLFFIKFLKSNKLKWKNSFLGYLKLNKFKSNFLKHFIYYLKLNNNSNKTKYQKKIFFNLYLTKPYYLDIIF